jgi:hypothetical protein
MSRLQTRMLSAGSLAALVAVMAAIDETFRGLLGSLLATHPAEAMESATANFHSVSRMMSEVLPVQVNQGPFLFFALTGGVLFVVMFRT